MVLFYYGLLFCIDLIPNKNDILFKLGDFKVSCIKKN